MEDNAAENENMDNAESECDPACTYPAEEHLLVLEGLRRLPSWTVYPAQLSNCMSAALRASEDGVE